MIGDMRSSPTGRRGGLTAVVMTVVSTIALAACTSSASPTGSPSSAGTGQGSTAPSASSPVTSAPGVITVTDKPSLRTTAALHVGQTLRVELGSTYWRFTALPANGVVRTAGAVAIAAGPSCIPGGGCGTVAQQYAAIGAGRTTITATRTTCGEALACRPELRTFTVTVSVSA
jgi:hypothetical protein